VVYILMCSLFYISSDITYDILFAFVYSHYLLHIFFFFFNDTATTEIYTLSLHDALPIFAGSACIQMRAKYYNAINQDGTRVEDRSEEHTSELQSRFDLVCRLLLEKKKNKNNIHTHLTTTINHSSTKHC